MKQPTDKEKFIAFFSQYFDIDTQNDFRFGEMEVLQVKLFSPNGSTALLFPFDKQGAFVRKATAIAGV